MKRKPPVLVLSDRSYVTLEQMMGAMALARLDFSQIAVLKREAEHVVSSLRRMKGGRE